MHTTRMGQGSGYGGPRRCGGNTVLCRDSKSAKHVLDMCQNRAKACQACAGNVPGACQERAKHVLGMCQERAKACQACAGNVPEACKAGRVTVKRGQLLAPDRHARPGHRKRKGARPPAALCLSTCASARAGVQQLQGTLGTLMGGDELWSQLLHHAQPQVVLACRAQVRALHKHTRAAEARDIHTRTWLRCVTHTRAHKHTQACRGGWRCAQGCARMHANNKLAAPSHPALCKCARRPQLGLAFFRAWRVDPCIQAHGGPANVRVLAVCISVCVRARAHVCVCVCEHACCVKLPCALLGRVYETR